MESKDLKELVKPNEVEQENAELDFYCETRQVCNKNSSLENDDEILF